MSEPIAVVTDFLDLLAQRRAAEAVRLLAGDVEWRNTGLPTIRGRRVAEMLHAMETRGVGFSADVHHIAADGRAVPLRQRQRAARLTQGPGRHAAGVAGLRTPAVRA